MGGAHLHFPEKVRKQCPEMLLSTRDFVPSLQHRERDRLQNKHLTAMESQMF